MVSCQKDSGQLSMVSGQKDSGQLSMVSGQKANDHSSLTTDHLIPCSGIILAGGLNSRFSGTNKAFIRVGNTRILDRIYGVFAKIFNEIIIVTNDPLAYIEWDAMIVTDILPVRSSLTGIHAGLFYAKNPYAFFAACDAPFIKKELVEMIVDNIEERFDVIIPETSAGFEALFAVYSKQCLKPVENNIRKDRFKISQIFRKMRVKKISEKKLREKDPDLVSFFNINTPEDLERAEKTGISFKNFFTYIEGQNE